MESRRANVLENQLDPEMPAPATPYRNNASANQEGDVFAGERNIFDQEHQRILPNQEPADWGPVSQMQSDEQSTFAQAQEHATKLGFEPSQQYSVGMEQSYNYSHGQQRYESISAEQQNGYELQHGYQLEYVRPPNSDHPSSDSNQKPSLVHRLWVWEVAASVFSIACIAVVIGILSYEQNKPLDHWQRGLGKKISPTAVVSFIGTIGKSACLLAVAEIISQLKWIHFGSQPRKLVDLQVFDDASRGPWGALQLALAKNRTALLAVCASVITIAALVMDPFIQLVFSFPSRLTPVTGATASILASQVYDPFALPSRYSQCYGSAQVDSVMQAAVLSPVWNATRAPYLPCGFERCEWPSITTLGVCSTCSDLTATVVSDCLVAGANKDQIECNYTLPSTNDTFITLFAVTGGASVRLPYQPLWNSTVRMYDSDGLSLYKPTESKPAQINKFSFISFAPDLPWQKYINHSSSENPILTSFPVIKQAMQCTLDLCARTFTDPYYANFSASQLSGTETPLNVTYVPQESSGRMLVELKPSKSDSLSMNTTFQVNLCDYMDLADYLGDLFTTDYSSGGMSGFSTDSRSQTQSITPNIGLALSQFGNITMLMQDIGDSMTETFRTSVNSTTYSGTGLNSGTYISITWAWLSLPIALVVLTFTLLVIVIIRNNARGIPAWKSSSFALLFHNLEGWDRSELKLNGPQELEKRVAKMTAQISNESGVPLFSKSYS